MATVAIVVSQAKSTPATRPAASICRRDDILMNRTCPSERMMNSRSGNHPLRRCARLSTVSLSKIPPYRGCPLLPRPLRCRDILAEANLGSLTRDKPHQFRDESNGAREPEVGGAEKGRQVIL